MNILHKSCARNRGVSYVELMVTIVIIAIGVIGLITALMAALKIDATTREKVIAVTAARDKMEQLKNLPLNGIFGQFGPAAPVVTMTPTAPSLGPTFAVEQIIATTPSVVKRQLLNAWVDPATGVPIPVGQIFFPVNAAGKVDETLRSGLPVGNPARDPSNLMPATGGRDLNRDGDALDTDVSTPSGSPPAPAYATLPVRILITWRAANGTKATLELGTMLNP